MPQGRRNSGRERKEKFDLELAHVVSFLHFIAVMTGALFVVSAAAFFLSERTPASDVVYGLTMAVNLVAATGAFAGARLLDKKDKQLLKREMERKLLRPGTQKQSDKKAENGSDRKVDV